MSRLSEIIENHNNLDGLMSILKHYGVNAQFVAASVIEQFDTMAGEESENKDNDDGNENADLLDDLKQYYARF